MRNVVLWGVLVVTLVTANVAVLGKERLLRDGRTVLLRLAPQDPRSLLQGDYMALRYVLAAEVRGRLNDVTSATGRVVVRLDGNDVASLVRMDDGSPLAGDEALLLFRKRGRDVWIGTDAFFFQEGQGPLYEPARWGEFVVAPDGDAILVGLRDETFRVLEPR